MNAKVKRSGSKGSAAPLRLHLLWITCLIVLGAATLSAITVLLGATILHPDPASMWVTQVLDRHIARAEVYPNGSSSSRVVHRTSSSCCDIAEEFALPYAVSPGADVRLLVPMWPPNAAVPPGAIAMPTDDWLLIKNLDAPAGTAGSGEAVPPGAWSFRCASGFPFRFAYCDSAGTLRDYPNSEQLPVTQGVRLLPPHRTRLLHVPAMGGGGLADGLYGVLPLRFDAVRTAATMLFWIAVILIFIRTVNSIVAACNR